MLVRPRIDPVRLCLRQRADAARRERPGEHPARLDRHRGDLQHVLGRQAQREQAVVAEVDHLRRLAVPGHVHLEIVADAACQREARIDVGHEERPASEDHDLVREEHLRGQRLGVPGAQERDHRHGMGVADRVRAAELEADRVEHRLHRRAPPRALLDRRERLRDGSVVGRGVVQQRGQRRGLQLDEVGGRHGDQGRPAGLDQHRPVAGAQRRVALAQDREIEGRIPERPGERHDLVELSRHGCAHTAV